MGNSCLDLLSSNNGFFYWQQFHQSNRIYLEKLAIYYILIFNLKDIIQLNYLDLKIGWVIEAFYFVY